ncbi:MAG TPA: RlmE family RNA methyltransferase [Rhodospirillales bacterium]|jgi:23S rRNA (uridine2552-2'-O)-methyltransferase|nr:RlmE family RNA methyltransferase [Rhodospirillales bacterium]
MTKKTSGTTDSGRGRTQRLRKSKGRKESSTRWLKRQLSDPYVAEAQERGLRSRAAFKLIELDDRFHFLKPGGRVVDLGAAPGGWTVVSVDRVNAQGTAKGKQGLVVGIDIQDTDPVGGATLICHDFMDIEAPGMLKAALNGPADVVLSDMAAPSTGHAATDHLRIVTLLETALDFACEVLSPGGAFVGKVFKGGTENKLLAEMKKRFATIKHAKPPSSRKESAETYVVATGFKK